MDLAYIGIAIVVALVLLTLFWGSRRSAPQRAERAQRNPERRYGGFRQTRDESDAL